MNEIASNNKRIAKNTALLYVRMIFVMFVSLFTSRIILQTLGIDDYGIYNVVGGFVSMLAFFTSSLSNATQRFLSIELGKNDLIGAQKIFNQSLWLYLLFAIAVVIIGESIGLWFVKEKLVIPLERLEAGVFTFHCSVLMTFFSILQVPYMSAIISREKMSVYAYMSILEAVLKLLIVYALLFVSDLDKLKLYAFLLLSVHALVTISYALYSYSKFEECRVMIIWNMILLKKISKFISFNVFGCFAVACGIQGINIVLNMFFGPAINAARGIAVQVNGAVLRFSDSIMTAIKPQIIKSYANQDINYMLQLVEYSSKYATFLMLLLATPIVANIDVILAIWLKTPPVYTNIFIVLMIIESLFSVLINPLWMVANATGHIKRSQVYGRFLTLLSLPISYFGYKVGFFTSPIAAFMILILTKIGYWLYSLFDIHMQVGLSYKRYLFYVVLPIIKTGIIPLFILIIVHQLSSPSIFRFFWFTALSCLVIGTSIYMFGMGEKERIMLRTQLKKHFT